MSLQIAVAHTGQRLDVDPVGFNSVEALKQWISKAAEIPPEAQILLTPRGKHVKLQALLTEVEPSLPYSDGTTNMSIERDIRLQSRARRRSAVFRDYSAPARSLQAR